MSSGFIDSDLLIIKTSESSFKNAKKLANEILNMRLAACISFCKIDSIYWWEEELEENSEVQLTIKTRLDLLNDIYIAIKNLHSYKLPEFIFFRASTSKEYNCWMEEVSKQANA